MAIFTLGTRGSLLALTQSTLVKHQLEQLFPQHQFVIKTIKTQGDLITDKPLWQIDGKDFFTKELDEALLSKEVDFVVHSFKDLSSTRPQGIFLAAVTNRLFSHDLMLIKKETVAKLLHRNMATLNIGTSSPRRQFQLAKHLKKFIPFGNNVSINFSNLRGNVNTRLLKLCNGEFDAICLAAAGLERLASHPKSLEELKSLLKTLELKFLPLSHFPSAPAQGALALECRENNKEILDLLSRLHSPLTFSEVQIEREIFQKYGGGCHLALGVMSRKLENGQQVVVANGHVDHHEIDLKYLIGQNQEQYKNQIAQSDYIFTGLTTERHIELNLPSRYLSDNHKTIKPLEVSSRPYDADRTLFYLTSEHTIDYFATNCAPSHLAKIWASGASLHEKLSQMGYWVTGDNDSLGKRTLLNFIESHLGLLYLPNATIAELSYKGKDNTSFSSIEAYESLVLDHPQNSDFVEKINSCKIFFWSSSKQFHFYSKKYPKILSHETLHFCGLGKTLDQLQIVNGIKLIPTLNVNHFLDSTK